MKKDLNPDPNFTYTQAGKAVGAATLMAGGATGGIYGAAALGIGQAGAVAASTTAGYTAVAAVLTGSVAMPPAAIVALSVVGVAAAYKFYQGTLKRYDAKRCIKETIMKKFNSGEAFENKEKYFNEMLKNLAKHAEPDPDSPKMDNLKKENPVAYVKALKNRKDRDGAAQVASYLKKWPETKSITIKPAKIGSGKNAKMNLKELKGSILAAATCGVDCNIQVGENKFNVRELSDPNMMKNFKAQHLKKEYPATKTWTMNPRESAVANTIEDICSKYSEVSAEANALVKYDSTANQGQSMVLEEGKANESKSVAGVKNAETRVLDSLQDAPGIEPAQPLKIDLKPLDPPKSRAEQGVENRRTRTLSV